MSKKKLNVANIVNELEGASLFFQSNEKKQAVPSPLPPPAPVTKLQKQETPLPAVPADKLQPTHPLPSANVRTNERSNERTNVRTKIRHTFDIFKDQLISLRKIAAEREEMFQERVLLGDLVQEALDMLITKERNKT